MVLGCTAQRRALGAERDPDEGCVNTLDNTAVSWMIIEKGYASLETPLVAPQKAVAHPDPSNLQVASGVGLIDD